MFYESESFIFGKYKGTKLNSTNMGGMQCKPQQGDGFRWQGLESLNKQITTTVLKSQA